MINIENDLLYDGLPFITFSFKKDEFESYLRTAGGYIPNLVEFINDDQAIHYKCYLTLFSPEDISIFVDNENKLCIEDSKQNYKQIIQLDQSLNVTDFQTTFVENGVIISINKKSF